MTIKKGNKMKHEIKLYGAIDGYWNSAEEIIGNIPADAKEITMRIHSPGGSVWEGVAIYNALRDHKAKVTTIVEGYAASIASVIMLAGDVRKIHKSSMVMIHNPWAMTGGNAEELRKVAENLDVCAEAIVGIYEDRTSMSKDEITDLMESESYFLGEVATDRGFSTEVINDAEAETKIAAMLTLDKFVAQTKETKMSKQKTRKEVEADLLAKDEELVQARADLDELKSASDASVIEAEAKHVEIVDAVKAELVTAQAELKTANDAIVAFEAKIVEADEAKAAVDAELVTAQAEIVTVKADLDSAKETLKNPAVADALISNAKIKAQAQADAEADDAEAKAEAEADDGEPKDIVDKYERMPQGAERQKFWSDNKKEILACMDKRGAE
ncbi:MAG: hypothetical protein GY833_23990 [Aestuariibacter sp.]|nr:hypothetical protein [Aestuariibacter sp.]